MEGVFGFIYTITPNSLVFFYIIASNSLFQYEFYVYFELQPLTTPRAINTIS